MHRALRNLRVVVPGTIETPPRRKLRTGRSWIKVHVVFRDPRPCRRRTEIRASIKCAVADISPDCIQIAALGHLRHRGKGLRVVRRRRPALAGLPPLTDTPSDLSFPSAHASSSFAGALVYSRLGLPAVPLYTLAGGLSISRLYLGVHYPSDVLAGALLGTALGRLLTSREAVPGAGFASAPPPPPAGENGTLSSARAPAGSPR